MLGVPGLWVHEDAVPLSLALEVVLGQGRAFVRSVRLLGEQSDLPVETFLAQAAEGYDQALRENERLRQEVARLEGSLSQFRDLEGSLKNTLLSAQKLADDLRENAAQEAARLVRDAEGRAEMVIQKAHSRLEDVQREIDGLKMKRREAETGIGSSKYCTFNFPS